MQTLCDRHPDIKMTNEFGNFEYTEQKFGKHIVNVLQRWRQVQGKWAFDNSYVNKNQSLAWLNLKFTLNYLFFLNRKCQRKRVTIASIEATYKALFPAARVVGDKLPHYLLHMEMLASQARLKRLVIFRDCRDVTSSFLEQVRTTWKGAPWTNQFDTAEKIATSWVRDIKIMEAYADKLLIVQYESLMRQPVEELSRISTWLNIDPEGFPVELLQTNSIGKYKQGLTPAEIDAVRQIAGPTMLRLGYVL